MSNQNASNLAAVSYVIPVRNPTEDLITTVQSIELCQLVREILVIDDFSNLGMEHLSAVEKLPRVRVIKNEREPGISGALNTGLNRVQGRYIARLDSGDLNLPNRTRYQVELLEGTGKDVVVSSMKLITESGIQRKQPLQKASFSKIFGVIAPWSVVPHPTWLIRASAIEVPYKSKYVRTEDYCFLAENHMTVSVMTEPTIIYDARGGVKVKKELIATFYKVRIFVQCASDKIPALFVGLGYGLARTLRFILWQKKYLKRS